MYLTKEVIKLLEGEETLRANAVLESNDENKSIMERAKGLEEIIISLADEDATPWLSFSLATLVIETVNWIAIVRHFRRKDFVVEEIE